MLDRIAARVSKLDVPRWSSETTHSGQSVVWRALKCDEVDLLGRLRDYDVAALADGHSKQHASDWRHS